MVRTTGLDCAAALGMFVYASSVVATPIILLEIADEMGFGLAAGGGMEALRAFFLLAILVLSGVLAARLGKVLCLAAGAAVLALGLFAYALSPSYAVVLAAIALVGLGGGVLEALMNPLVQEQHPQDSARYLNILNAFFSFGVCASVLSTGELLTRGVSWRAILVGLAVLALGSGLLFVVFGRSGLFYKIGSERSKKVSGGSFAQSANCGIGQNIRKIAVERKFWLFCLAMFCGGGAEGAFTFWSASYIQLHFAADARMGALGTAAFAGGMVAGRFGVGHFAGQKQLPRWIIASSLLGIAASLGAWAVAAGAASTAAPARGAGAASAAAQALGAGASLWAFIALLFVAGLAVACFWPSIQSHAAAVIPCDMTMLFILLSCAGIPGFGLVAWIMGIIAERYGLRTSLLLVPFLFVVLALAIWRIDSGGSRQKS